MTPTLLKLSTEDMELATIPASIPSLREISLGGESMPELIAEVALKSWEPIGLRLVNTYGLTEGCIYQTEHLVRNTIFEYPHAMSLVKSCSLIGNVYSELKCGLVLATETGSQDILVYENDFPVLMALSKWQFQLAEIVRYWRVLRLCQFQHFAKALTCFQYISSVFTFFYGSLLQYLSIQLQL